MIVRIVLPAALFLATLTATAPPPADAFQEFAAICGRTMALWGVSTCGPMLLVDPTTRAIITNRPDTARVLRRNGATWTGVLPIEVGIANTALAWSGTRWSMIMLPLPADARARRVLMAHEAFHRIQPALGFNGSERDNGHLDGETGRVWLRLELNALDRALASRPGWRRAARDAIAFRAKRRTLAGAAAGSAEDALERNEGLAEYTGIKVGAGAEAIATARLALEDFATRPSFVRSFAYATGPAYGLLLDRFGADWREEIRRHPEATFATLLAIRIGSGGGVRDLDAYGGVAIRREEAARAVEIAKRDAGYRALLVNGPTVTIDFIAMNIEFNPNRVFALPGEGSVYETMRVRDAWGTLDMSRGALLASDWSKVRVAGPAVKSGELITGPGWTLKVAPDWALTGDSKAQRLAKTPG